MGASAHTESSSWAQGFTAMSHPTDAPSPGAATARPLGLVLVDDHPAVRRGLSALLATEDDLRVLAAVASAEEGLAAIERLRPDVALLDFHLPKDDGLSLCLRTRALSRPPRVLVFSAFADEALALQATVAGAHGVLAKDAPFEELCAAVRAVARGERRLAPASPPVVAAHAAALAPADRPILALLRERVPEEEIADTLGLDLGWLRARRWAILGRLGEQSRRHGHPRRRAGSAGSSAAPPSGPEAA